MEIISYHAPDVPLRLYSRLSQLTLRNGGLMWRTFKDCGEGLMIGRVYIAYVEGRIRGWCIRWRHPSCKEWHLYTFTQYEYQRQGIASSLVNAATRNIKKEGNVRCYPWDSKGSNFFTKVYQTNSKIDILF